MEEDYFTLGHYRDEKNYWYCNRCNNGIRYYTDEEKNIHYEQNHLVTASPLDN